MKGRSMMLGTAALLAGALTSCQSWGPTWSEVTGVRYHRAIADRLPATVVAVGNQPVFMTPFMVAPGTYRVTVESPRHDGVVNNKDTYFWHRLPLVNFPAVA